LTSRILGSQFPGNAVVKAVPYLDIVCRNIGNSTSSIKGAGNQDAAVDFEAAEIDTVNRVDVELGNRTMSAVEAALYGIDIIFLIVRTEAQCSIKIGLDILL
jgi:hypothetical protein